MKYISLFTGIGGFELAIHTTFPSATCIGYSEVDKFAIQVYTHHFPTHANLGDITAVTEEQIKELVETQGCDLVVGGFPCQNLSSLSWQHSTSNSQGLDGPKSGLFWTMIRIIQWIQKWNPTNTQLHLLIENNANMKKIYRAQITDTLQKLYSSTEVHCTLFNGADFGVQNRRRLYWTTFPVFTDGIECTQAWCRCSIRRDERTE